MKPLIEDRDSYLEARTKELLPLWAWGTVGIQALFLLVETWYGPGGFSWSYFALRSIGLLGSLYLVTWSAKERDVRITGGVLVAWNLAIVSAEGWLFAHPNFDSAIQLLILCNGLLWARRRELVGALATIVVFWGLVHTVGGLPLAQVEQVFLLVTVAVISVQAGTLRQSILHDQYDLLWEEAEQTEHIEASLDEIEAIRGKLAERADAQEKSLSLALGELRELQEQREELHALLTVQNRLRSFGRLSAGIAHRLNNLMLAMQGAIELSEAGSPGDLRRLHRATLKGSKLTYLLLSMGARQHLSPVLTSVGQLVRSYRPDLESRLRVGLEWRVEEQAESSELLVDPSAWFEILEALLRNAEEADKSRSRQIQVQIEDQGDWLVMAVEDGGPGLPEGAESQVFEPFYTTKRPEKHPGIGLSLVLGLSEQMGAKVGYRRGPELGGARFEVSFPIQRSQAP